MAIQYQYKEVTVRFSLTVQIIEGAIVQLPVPYWQGAERTADHHQGLPS